ncbi:MAG TPA: class I SAM-dependent methyltransferase [Thermoanaerobaculia bacterium]|jgi:O-antigen chain-terminating methyltransferase
MAAKENLAEELAQEIRAAIAGANPATLSPRPAAPDSGDLEDVRIPIRRAEEHLTPTIPQAARFARAKSLALRMLRFLWRDQASFNALSLEAANGVVAALERNRAAMEDQARRYAELASWRKAIDQHDAGQDARIAHLETLGTRPATSTAAGSSPEIPSLPESVYALFEERFRGSSTEIAQKQRFYLRYVRDLPGPVFDAGCGRGEFLRLLREEGIAARGVESSSHSAEACRAEGLDVTQGDAIEALAETPSATLGAVVAFQVVEHWPAAATFRFLAEARRAIAPGGVVIVETVNTDSLAAMNAFYLDPTHVRPVPPEALHFLCDAVGFRELTVEFLSPLPAEERLDERSENDVRLNAILFGPQDYAVIGRVPVP